MEMYSSEELEQEAAGYEHANNLAQLPASAYNWQAVQNFPISNFLKPSAGTNMKTPDDWIEWYREENEWSDVDIQGGRWGYLEKEDEIVEPVIVVYNEQGEWHLWDGWHRTASSFAAGRKSLPAIVGTPK